MAKPMHFAISVVDGNAVICGFGVDRVKVGIKAKERVGSEVPVLVTDFGQQTGKPVFSDIEAFLVDNGFAGVELPAQIQSVTEQAVRASMFVVNVCKIALGKNPENQNGSSDNRDAAREGG